MSRYIVSHAVTEDSAFGEESHLAATISGEFPDAESQPDGGWVIIADLTADDILAKLSEGVSEESVMICAVPAA